MGKIEIREATGDDIDVVAGLWLKFVRHHQDIESGFELEEGYDEYYREYFRKLAEDSTVGAFIAYVDGCVAGYTLGGLKPCPPPLKRYYFGLVAELFVEPEYRKLGIARRLLDRLGTWFREKKVKYVEIEVLKSNEGGVSFWSGLGFRTWKLVMRKDP